MPSSQLMLETVAVWANWLKGLWQLKAMKRKWATESNWLCLYKQQSEKWQRDHTGVKEFKRKNNEKGVMTCHNTNIEKIKGIFVLYLSCYLLVCQFNICMYEAIITRKTAHSSVNRGSIQGEEDCLFVLCGKNEEQSTFCVWATQ